MKKFLLNFGILSLCAMSFCLVSCGGDDDDIDLPGGDDNPTYTTNIDKVLPMGRPTSVGPLSSMVYDVEGRLKSAYYKHDNETLTFDYKGNSVLITSTHKDSDTGQTYSSYANCKIGENGYISEFTVDYPGEDSTTFYLYYDSAGHLIQYRYKDSDSERDLNIYYDEEGDIVRVEDNMVDQYNGMATTEITSTTIAYTGGSVTSKIENKGGIMLFDECFNVDFDSWLAAYYAGLVGIGTTHLPISSTTEYYDSSNYVEDFTWTLNSKGLPTSVLIDSKAEWGNYSETLSIVW